MALTETAEPTAADALDQTENEQTTDAAPEEQDEPAGREDTFFLPKGFPGSDKLKTGDSVTLKVVANADGEIEVECAGDGEGEGKAWKDDLKQSLK